MASVTAWVLKGNNIIPMSRQEPVETPANTMVYMKLNGWNFLFLFDIHQLNSILPAANDPSIRVGLFNRAFSNYVTTWA